MKYKIMYLIGEKEGIFYDKDYLKKDGELLTFDTEEAAEEYRRGHKRWHVVEHKGDVTC